MVIGSIFPPAQGWTTIVILTMRSVGELLQPGTPVMWQRYLVQLVKQTRILRSVNALAFLLTFKETQTSSPSNR